MQLNKLPGSKVQFEVVIPVELFKKSVDEAFEKKNQEVEIKGFRKGHAPREAYENIYGVESLYPDALNAAIGETYYNAVTEANIDVCGYPKIDLDETKVNPKEPIHYFVTVSVFPEVTLGEYTNLGIKKNKVSVSQKEVNEDIERTLERESMLVKKAGEEVKVEAGDTVVFDFEGFKDGVAFEGGSAKDYSLEIGSNQFIPGFEDQMIGMKEGEEKELNVTFPEDYHAENLKGAKVVFKVNVKEIKIKEKPVLDDEFVKGLKIDGVDTADAYKKHIRKEIKEHKEEHADEDAKQALYQKVVENSTFELADDLIDEEADYSLKQAEAQAKQYNLDLQTLLMYTGGGTVEEFKAKLHEQAKNTLSLKFVLKAIVAKEGFEATKEEIEEKTKEIADNYKMTVDQVLASLPESAIAEEVKTQKAYDFIAEKNPFVTE